MPRWLRAVAITMMVADVMLVSVLLRDRDRKCCAVVCMCILGVVVVATLLLVLLSCWSVCLFFLLHLFVFVSFVISWLIVVLSFV